VPVFRWKEGFVVDGFLDVSHHVVNVLRSRQLAFFSFFVKPHVDTLTRTRHVGTCGEVAELRDSSVEKVDVLKEANRVQGKPLIWVEAFWHLCDRHQLILLDFPLQTRLLQIQLGCLVCIISVFSATGFAHKPVNSIPQVLWQLVQLDYLSPQAEL